MGIDNRLNERAAKPKRDKILWALTSRDGKLSISRLRQHTGLPQAELDSIALGH